MTPILLDTCALIWIANEDPISPGALKLLNDVKDINNGTQVSPISAWEIGLLCARKRLLMSSPPETMFKNVTDIPGVGLAPMLPDTLIASSFLPGEPPADPADRIIIATARIHGLQIMTRDQHILRYSRDGYVMSIQC